MAKKQKEGKKETENKFYTVGKWHGMDNYECRFCAFATLNRREIARHSEVHIRGNPELAGIELLPEDLLPEVDEDHGLTPYEPVEEEKQTDQKETYQGPKKGKGKNGEK